MKLKDIFLLILTYIGIIIALPFVLVYVVCAFLFFVFVIVFGIFKDSLQGFFENHKNLYPKWLKRLIERWFDCF